MSQVSSDSDAIVSAFQAELGSISTIWSTVALFIYEYILTANQEVTMIWRRKWTSVTWLFVANRYLMIANAIFGLMPSTAQSCPRGITLNNVFHLMQYFIFAAFSALRVFAIWDRSLLMTLLVLVLNLTPIATNVYLNTQTKASFTVDPILGTYCGFIINIPASTVLNFAIGARLAVIIADILVLALTWRKTFTHWRDAVRVGVRTPLSALLLRDGSIYFFALLAMNIAQVLVDSVPLLQTSSPVVNIIAVLIPILISRFLLNLRQLGEPENETQSRFNSRFSIPGFRVPTLASIVGDMGADLDHGPAEEVNEETDDADVNARLGNEGTAAIDAMDELQSSVATMETIYEIQEVPRDAV